jgi:hypothetical protein
MTKVIPVSIIDASGMNERIGSERPELRLLGLVCQSSKAEEAALGAGSVAHVRATCLHRRKC